MEAAVSAPESELRPGGGRSNGVRPSLSSASNIGGAVVLPAGVGAPRNFMARYTCGELLPDVAMNQPWPYRYCDAVIRTPTAVPSEPGMRPGSA